MHNASSKDHEALRITVHRHGGMDVPMRIPPDEWRPVTAAWGLAAAQHAPPYSSRTPICTWAWERGWSNLLCRFLTSCNASTNSLFWSMASAISRGCSCKLMRNITLIAMRLRVMMTTTMSFSIAPMWSRSVRNTQMRSNEFIMIAMYKMTSRIRNHSPRPSALAGNGLHVIHVILYTRRRYSKTWAMKPMISIDGLTMEKQVMTEKLRMTSTKSSTYDPPHDSYS
mmetsp:Transcript_100736/g.282292  ORF Transcript_100736/g.282292 Transcript_100736/m.282292 type:complete len:226 (+) Transcript_100736:127-804(+)